MSDIKEIRAKLVAETAGKANSDKQQPGTAVDALIGFAVLGLICWGIWTVGSLIFRGASKPTPTAQIPAAQVEKSKQVAQPAPAQAKEPPKLDRFHCLSAWDGTYSALIKAVKENLRDPGSFEHVETRIGEIKEDGRQEVIMRYRAKNGFGGLNVQYAKGTLFNLNCDLLDWKG